MSGGKVKLVPLLAVLVLLVLNIFAVPSLASSTKPLKPEPVEVIPTTSAEPTETTETEYTFVELSETDVSPADTTETEPTELKEYDIKLPYYITVDKKAQVVSIYTTNEEGKYETLVRQCICSTGENIDKLPDGVYPLKDVKYKWEKMLSHGDPLYAQYVTKITGSFLFHSVPYTETKKNKLDMARYKKLGTACSGGCIRLTVECAKWIYENCPKGTPVKVFKGTYDEELIKKLRPPAPKNGWDPTDPDPKNPNYQPQYDESTEPKPYVYAPLYDYNWDWAEECERIFYTTTKKKTTTTSGEQTTAATTTTTETTKSTTKETTTTTTKPTDPPPAEPEGSE